MYDIYRDVASVYAYYAREIGNGDWAGGWVGRVPMLHIILSGVLAAAGLEAYTATIIISSAFYILTLFPLRSLLSRYLNPLQAAWGCVLFIFAPKIIRFSISGLLDPERYFFLITAVLFFFRLADHRKWGDGVWLGLSLAGLSVSRGEGLPIAIMLLLLWPLYGLLKKRFSRNSILKRGLGIWVLAITCWFLGIMPFCLANLKLNGSFTTDLRLTEMAAGLKTRLMRQNPHSPATAATEISGHDIHVQTLPEKILAVLDGTSRGACEFYLFFTLAGIIFLWKKRKWNAEYTLFLLIFLFHTVIYFLTPSSYRYYIYLVPLFMPFTICGLTFCLREICRFTERQWDAVSVRRCNLFFLCLVCAGILIGQMFNGINIIFRRRDVTKREVACFIRQYAKDNYPGRRIKLAAVHYPETVYWSMAYSVCGYRSGGGLPDLNTFRDFDLLMLPRDKKLPPPEFKGLTRLELPEHFPVIIYRNTVISSSGS